MHVESSQLKYWNGPRGLSFLLRCNSFVLPIVHFSSLFAVSLSISSEPEELRVYSKRFSSHELSDTKIARGILCRTEREKQFVAECSVVFSAKMPNCKSRNPTGDRDSRNDAWKSKWLSVFHFTKYTGKKKKKQWDIYFSPVAKPRKKMFLDILGSVVFFWISGRMICANLRRCGDTTIR